MNFPSDFWQVDFSPELVQSWSRAGPELVQSWSILKPCLLFHSPVSCSKLFQTCFNVNLAYSKRVSKFTSKIELFCTNFMTSRKIWRKLGERLEKGWRKFGENFSTPLKILQFCSIFQNSFSIVFFRAFKIILII